MGYCREGEVWTGKQKEGGGRAVKGEKSKDSRELKRRDRIWGKRSEGVGRVMGKEKS